MVPKRHTHNALKETGERNRRGNGQKVNQGRTKGGKEERSFSDMDTIQIQKSGIGTENTRSPGDEDLCWKEKRQELALSGYPVSAGYSCDHNNPAKEVLSAPGKTD